ncbi:MAG: FecR domain-containing protein [Actinobacteria bacterium]|nr:FecR domain-containing protein [Actinomycetota bacterium]MBU1942360.1 FecR domain-containing protein [Actinomycetota bacterium]MBU2686354.1 FecR domain-containing protein [Actinomycetota bacterium]
MASRRDRNRIEVDEGFDAGYPVAELLRTLPPDAEMSDEARERLLVHMQSVRRRVLRGGLKAPHSTARKALVPAMAVLVILAVVAAVLIPLLLIGGGNAPGPGGATALLDGPLGKVTVRVGDEGWRKARNGEKLIGGDQVRTGPDSSVSVLFGDGSIMRVTDDSEAKLVSLGEQSVSVEHVVGGTYHRVKKGSSYAVAVGEVQSRAVGTAFNVDCRTPGFVEVLSVESAVSVEIGEHDPIKVGEGEVITVSTSGDKKAEKQSVTRERLNEPRLLESVRKDKDQGFSTGIYQAVGETLTGDQQSVPAPEPASSELTLRGTGSTSGVRLNWSVPSSDEYHSIKLLRCESGEPVYPDNVISSYEDTDITSAEDNNVEPGHTYQYRLCALLEGGQAIYSNTVLVSLPGSAQPPEPVKVNLVADRTPNGVRLEWTVAGASDFDGFVVERTVTAAPAGSETPAGSSMIEPVDSRDVLLTWLDTSATSGHTYTYRVGLTVGDAVMVYSDPVTIEVSR